MIGRVMGVMKIVGSKEKRKTSMSEGLAEGWGLGAGMWGLDCNRR